ncbi:ClpXP adapter SpxH family protein [Bacillus ectoiniformans]|uniref:ClpXP adapter SpxH family protein n=1 Tax=Bacillus ectoiniformans TaxID=1494429 RepID=UPI0019560486|nr:ClpXP adapter SpxH family protein [Bacillus ectoiniformans]
MYATQQKPLEIYMFVDPLCPECWALEPYIRKLQLEYGHYFRLKKVLTGKLETLNLKKNNCQSIAQQWDTTASRTGMSCDGNVWVDNPVSSPFLASISIKAAELQGRRAGNKFLRKLQEVLFLGRRNISDIAVLTQCAEDAGLDKAEFLNDIHSASAAKAFQCDLKISCEMDVTEVPTLVFFNENIEEEGIKISGLYSYEIYVQILQEMLEEIPEPLPLPALEDMLKHYQLVATKEISEMYNWTGHEVDKEMKKLLLQRKVRKLPAKHGNFWEYIG